jgi:hypothetical protein
MVAHPPQEVEVGTRMLEVGRHLQWMDETVDGTTDSATAMHELLDRQGYMLLRKLIPREAVLTGCRRIAETLAASGWLAPGRDPALLELAVEAPNGGFMLQASEQDEIVDAPAIRRVLAGPELMDLFGVLFGEDPATFTFKWFRAMCPGQSSGFHVDNVYMGKGSTQLYSVWLPWHDVDIDRGGLVVLDQSNSHVAYKQLRDTYGMHDYEHSRIDTGVGNTVANSGWFTRDPAELLALHPQGCWRTAQYFEAGDIVVFPMQTMHGTVANTTCSPALLRLSCDIRFQPFSDPVDPRHTLTAKGEDAAWDRADFEKRAAAHAAATPRNVPMQSLADAKREWGIDRQPLASIRLAPARPWPPVPWRAVSTTSKPTPSASL